MRSSTERSKKALLAKMTQASRAVILFDSGRSKNSLLVKIIQSVRGNPVLIEISVLCPP